MGTKNQSNAGCVLSTSSQIGDINNCQVGYWRDETWYPWDWNQFYPYYTTPIYPTYNIVEDKISRSFKIVNMLMTKGLIREITIQQFVELVSDISTLL